jgi:hypothetical protein
MDYLQRTPRSYRYQDLIFEPWAIAFWTNYGLISYRDYAEFIIAYTELKAYGLLTTPKGIIEQPLFYLVKGVQQSYYTVSKDGKTCNCMLYRQRLNRREELLQLFQYLPSPSFCHHSEAVRQLLS